MTDSPEARELLKTRRARVIRDLDPADLAPGDRLLVNGNAYRVTDRPEVDHRGRVWVDVDLGGLDLPACYAPGDDVTAEVAAGVVP